MRVPYKVALPAIAATAAYLNARTQFSYDFYLLTTLAKSAIEASRLDRQDRVNYFYRLEEHAQDPKTKDHVFLIYEGNKWTFKETYDIALRYGSWLRATHGVAPRQVVALDYMNCPEYVFMMLGLWSIGATPALINYNLTGKALIHCIRTSTARLLIAEEELKEKFSPDVLEEISANDFYKDEKGSVTIRFHNAALEKEITQTLIKREPDSTRSGAGCNSGSRVAALIYTSGTTGLPKAAVGWIKAYGVRKFMVEVVGLNKQDIYYTCMPLYHSTALVIGLLPCLIGGYTSSIGRRFSNQTFWPEVRQSHATMIQYVGETCRYLLAAPTQIDTITGEDLDQKHNVRLAFGNGMRPDVWQRFKDRFGIETITEFYGATEGPNATFNISSNDFSRGAIGKRGTITWLLTRKKIAVVEIDWESEGPKRDPQNHNFCSKVPWNTPGELLFWVDPNDLETRYQGYFNNPKATDSKLLRDVFTEGDAWFRTGDCVRMDYNGLMWFSDRIGDTFRWRSENVSTNEVSEVLGNHPSISEANVYGVEVPRHDGRCGCAAVTFHSPPDPQQLQSLAQHATSSLPKYAVPLFLRVMRQMHSTGNNKQQKHALRTQGVDPAMIDTEDQLLWLQNGTYVEFRPQDYQRLETGQVHL